MIPVAEFANKELSLAVNIYEVNGEPMFDALEVSKVLGYERPQQTLIDIHKRFEKQGYASNVHFATIAVEGSRKDRPKKLKVCSETVIYDLAFSSRLPSAQKFRYWVASEVLPTIRRTGGYISQDASPEQLDKLKEQVELWKTRALEKREEALQLKDERDEWEQRARDERKEKNSVTQQKNMWENRAVHAKDTILITKEELKKNMQEIMSAVKSSRFSGIKDQLAQMDEIYRNTPKKMTIKEYQFECTRIINVIADMFYIVDDHRCKGWTYYKNATGKTKLVRSSILLEMLAAQAEGRMGELVREYIDEVNSTPSEEELEIDSYSV